MLSFVEAISAPTGPETLIPSRIWAPGGCRKPGKESKMGPKCSQDESERAKIRLGCAERESVVAVAVRAMREDYIL